MAAGIVIAMFAVVLIGCIVAIIARRGAEPAPILISFACMACIVVIYLIVLRFVPLTILQYVFAVLVFAIPLGLFTFLSRRSSSSKKAMDFPASDNGIQQQSTHGAYPTNPAQPAYVPQQTHPSRSFPGMRTQGAQAPYQAPDPIDASRPYQRSSVTPLEPSSSTSSRGASHHSASPKSPTSRNHAPQPRVAHAAPRDSHVSREAQDPNQVVHPSDMIIFGVAQPSQPQPQSPDSSQRPSDASKTIIRSGMKIPPRAHRSAISRYSSSQASESSGFGISQNDPSLSDALFDLDEPLYRDVVSQPPASTHAMLLSDFQDDFELEEPDNEGCDAAPSASLASHQGFTYADDAEFDDYADIEDISDFDDIPMSSGNGQGNADMHIDEPECVDDIDEIEGFITHQAPSETPDSLFAPEPHSPSPDCSELDISTGRDASSRSASEPVTQHSAAPDHHAEPTTFSAERLATDSSDYRNDVPTFDDLVYIYEPQFTYSPLVSISNYSAPDDEAAHEANPSASSDDLNNELLSMQHNVHSPNEPAIDHPMPANSQSEDSGMPASSHSDAESHIQHIDDSDDLAVLPDYVAPAVNPLPAGDSGHSFDTPSSPSSYDVETREAPSHQSSFAEIPIDEAPIEEASLDALPIEDALSSEPSRADVMDFDDILEDSSIEEALLPDSVLCMHSPKDEAEYGTSHQGGSSDDSPVTEMPNDDFSDPVGNEDEDAVNAFPDTAVLESEASIAPTPAPTPKIPELDELIAKANAFKQKGMYEIAARFYREASALSDNSSTVRSLRFSELSCYTKLGDKAHVAQLVSELKSSSVLTKAERMKLQASEKML